MARFFGKVGYSHSVRTKPGVTEDVIVEKEYFGDVLKNIRRLEGERPISDLAVSNSISIVADAFANEHFAAIQYVEWMGTLWTVTTVDVERPRLILRLGEVYNGPKA